MGHRDRQPGPPEGLSPEEAERVAFIKAEADRAVAPYVGLFPPDVIDAFRERVEVFLGTHPEMARLVDAALPKVGPHASTVRPTESAEALPSMLAGRRKGARKP